MKQVYATGPLAPSGNSGRPAVRAASAGANADAVQTALGFANYLPPSVNGDEPAKKMPVRLSLIGSSAGRVLTHVAPNGGTYFAHSLLDVPAGTDAHTAIQTWGSPLWQRHEPEAGADLPDLPFLPVADLLDDEAVRIWLSVPSHREMLEYAFAALLVAPKDGRVILAASADDVATVVYAVTRAFPSNLTDDFTFSTYEADPLGCRAKLVGRDGDLPDGCYRDANFGYDPQTGRKTPLPREIGFAAFAANALATGDVAALDDFRGTWQRLGLADANHFDLIDRMARGGEWAKAELAAVVPFPAVPAWLAGKPDVVRQLTEWAIDDRDFATGPYARVVQAMRQKPDSLTKLSGAVQSAGFAAVNAGETTQAGNAFDVILPMVAPAKAATVWADVIAKVPDPATLSWPMRWYLLPRLARFAPQANGSASVDKWLRVPAGKLGELLTLEIPKSLHVSAARAAWADAIPNRADEGNDSAGTVAKALSAHPSLAMTVLQPEDSSPAAAERCASLFETLLKVAPGRPWFEDVLAVSSEYPKSLLNRFFEADLAAGRADADRVVRTHGPKLFDLFEGQSGLETLGTRFLAAPPADLLNQPVLLEFLRVLKGRDGIGDALLSQIGAVLTTRHYLDRPSFAAEAMAPVAAALELAPTPLPSTAKVETFRAVAKELTARADEAGFQTELEAVLNQFGDVLAKGPSDLFQDLLRELRQSPDFTTHPNLVSSSLATALGAVSSPELAARLSGLEPDAFAVASDAAKAGKTKLLAEIDRRTADWPKDAKAKWGFLMEAVRPRGRFVRDLCCVAFGMAVVGVAWGVVKMMNG